MDKFYRDNLNDFSNRKSLAKEKAGTSNAGLGAADYIGLGLQLYGASRADAAAEEEQKKLDQQRLEEQIYRGRQDRQSAQLFEEKAQNQKRLLNMSGLDYLANQRAEVMKNRRYTTLRNNFAQALSGGR